MKGISKKLLALAFILSTTTSLMPMDPLDDASPLLSPDNQVILKNSAHNIGKNIEAKINSGQEQAKVLINNSLAKATPAVNDVIDSATARAQKIADNSKIAFATLSKNMEEKFAKRSKSAKDQHVTAQPILIDVQPLEQMLPVDKTGEVPVAQVSSSVAQTAKVETASKNVQTSWYQRTSATIAQPFKAAWSHTGTPACHYVSNTASYKKHPYLTVSAIATAGIAAMYGIYCLYKYCKNRPAQAQTK